MKRKFKRIHVQSQTSGLQITLFVILAILIGLYVFQSNMSPNKYFIFVGIVAVGLIKYFCDSKAPYVSDILVFDKFIELIYKIKGRTVSKTIVKKNDISKFFVQINAVECNDRITDCNMKITISLQNKNPIFFPIKLNQLSLDGWKIHQKAINIVKNGKDLPNFSYEVKGSKYIEKELEKYSKTGKGFSFFEQISIGYKTSTATGKIRTIIGLTAIIVTIALFLFFIIAINFLIH